MSKVQFGVQLPLWDPTYTPKPRQNPHGTLYYKITKPDPILIKKIAKEAEKLGFDSIWVIDHLSKTSSNQMFECWTTMTWLAAQTSKIRIGSLVICPLYRHPSILAKMSSTFDVLSKGRLELGLGACGFTNYNETAPRGIKWYGPKNRIQILEETIQILKELWTREESNFTGKHFQLNKASCTPKPIQHPHPPITIASWGEKLGLRVVARYADRSNFGLVPFDTIKHKLSVLRKHCESVGRDYESIIKSAEIGVILHSTYDEYIEEMRKRFDYNVGEGSFEEWVKEAEKCFITGTPEMCIEQLQEYIDLGLSYFMIRFGDLPDLNGIRLFQREVAPKINR
jgi:alkanesulfonate monooxygenase SsuD/methylene tetrahydromethanopterin reductase-like flavin-dependent oxidoreductase (luciferase family)